MHSAARAGCFLVSVLLEGSLLALFYFTFLALFIRILLFLHYF